MKIDIQKINHYIEKNKSNKPPYIEVSDEEWENALLGYQETLSEAITEDMTTEQFWTLIYFSAMAFCKGFQFAEVKAGLRKESYYPRY